MRTRIRACTAAALCLALVACSGPSASETTSSGARPASAPIQEDAHREDEEAMTTCTIHIADKAFEAQLESNDCAQAFAELLPAELVMDELNGNEKYHYLDSSLPSDPACPGRIETGDLMLYGRDCVVLFYESFDTSYAYTRIGHVSDVNGLAEALGAGSVTVTFDLVS